MTLDQIDQMVRQANPVPDPTVIRAVETSVLPKQERMDMQTQNRVEVEKRPSKGPLLGMAAAVAIFVSALLLLPSGNDAPVARQPTTSVEIAAPEAAPPELEGTWMVGVDVVGGANPATFTFSGKRFEFARGPVPLGAGRISVEGNQITLSLQNTCSGVGIYQWSVEGDSITFTALEVDPCPVRYELLDGVTYTR